MFVFGRPQTLLRGVRAPWARLLDVSRDTTTPPPPSVTSKGSPTNYPKLQSTTWTDGAAFQEAEKDLKAKLQAKAQPQKQNIEAKPQAELEVQKLPLTTPRIRGPTQESNPRCELSPQPLGRVASHFAHRHAETSREPAHVPPPSSMPTRSPANRAVESICICPSKRSSDRTTIEHMSWRWQHLRVSMFSLAAVCLQGCTLGPPCRTGLRRTSTSSRSTGTATARAFSLTARRSLLRSRGSL